MDEVMDELRSRGPALSRDESHCGVWRSSECKVSHLNASVMNESD